MIYLTPANNKVVEITSDDLECNLKKKMFRSFVGKKPNYIDYCLVY